jgi:hypothetical protein
MLNASTLEAMMSDFQLAVERAEELVGPKFWAEFTQSQRAQLIYQQLAYLDAAHDQLSEMTKTRYPQPRLKQERQPEPERDHVQPRPLQPPPRKAPSNPFHVPKRLVFIND